MDVSYFDIHVQRSCVWHIKRDIFGPISAPVVVVLLIAAEDVAVLVYKTNKVHFNCQCKYYVQL